MDTSASGEELVHTVSLWINGQQHVSQKTFDIKSPASGRLAHRCSAASVDDANAAVDAANNAFASWRTSTPSQRQNIFLRAAEIMAKRSGELMLQMQGETGAFRDWCEFNIETAIAIIRDIAGRVPALEGSFPTLEDPNRSGIVLQEPFGVVLAIAPWNAPYILGMRSVAFPIAAGNTVVLKGTELAPRCMSEIVSIFQEAGLPPGVLNMIIHESSDAPAVTAALIANPSVKKINFTGSTNVGRIIGRLAGDALKPVVLELGGKAPAIVWEDADLELAAQKCALGSFLNSGQICMSTEKILVHKAVKPEFIKKLCASIEEIFPSSSEAFVLINEVAAEKNKALVADAVSKGASIIMGSLDSRQESGARMRPIVVDNVSVNMDLYYTESFGPTVSIINIQSEEEAVKIANDSEFGLSSAVFTEDLRRGLRIARQIESGAVHINSMTVHDEPALPHGGVKGSGYGRFNTSRGLQEWVRTKTVTYEN